jgi:hypothetical protein
MVNNMNRLEKFSKKQVAAIELGKELAKHYCYEKENINGRYNKFECFARTTNDAGKVISYAEKNNLFWNLAIDEAYEISKLDKERFSVEDAFSFPQFERAFFSIIEETINSVITKTEIEQSMLFAEVKSVSEGDSLVVHIPSNHLLSVSTVANGVRNVHFQKLWEEDYTLNPKVKKTGVAVDIHRIAANMYDWGWLINWVGKSFRTKLQQEVVDIVYGGYNTLATQFKEATYAQESFIQLGERVASANNAPVTVIGTRTALSPILPTNDYLKMGLGQEYMDNGYITAPFGFPTIKLEQSIKTNSTYDFAISNDYVVLISSTTDKIVKIGTSGQTKVRLSKEFDTSDDTRNYTITSDWEVKLLSMAYYGVCKVR